MKSPLYQNREQTEVKHKALERYLEAAVPIVDTWAADIIYVDCLAGPWKAKGENLEDTSFSRALNVLRKSREALAKRFHHPNFRALLNDNDVEAFQQLEAFCPTVRGVDVKCRQWDFHQHVNDFVRFIQERPRTFAFIFIDPTGWELTAIDLIRPLLQLPNCEVLINLMTSWITRFLADQTKPYEKLVGTHVGKLRQLQGDEQEEELVRCYGDAVRATGPFKFVCTLPVMKAENDAFYFHLIYGTRHPKGVEEFKRMEKIVGSFMHSTRAELQSRKQFQRSGGQNPLFTPEETYLEKRYSRLQKTNSSKARAHLQKALQTSRQILYDDAWALTAQYSTVLEPDVQEWIAEWRETGHVEIINAKPDQQPKRKQNHILRWK